MKRTWFITGTDTSAGKTVLSVLLTRFLVQLGRPVHAVKPICSGARADPEALQEALLVRVPIDKINPWFFTPPISPARAAKLSGHEVTLADVLAFLRPHQEIEGELIIEGAGGILSPLGIDFDNRELFVALRARPILVCPNRLGMINQARLAWEAVPLNLRPLTAIFINEFGPADASTPSNVVDLAEFLPLQQTFVLPNCPNWGTCPIPPVLTQFIQWADNPPANV